MSFAHTKKKNHIMASTTSAQATALVSGSFLSGAMMSLSFIAVPVFLDTTAQAPQLFQQWARMYSYGHQALPTLAVGTCLLHLYTAVKRRGAKKSWGIFAVAGVTTLIMLPFTWLVMTPTNNELFGLVTLSKSEPGIAGIAGARELVARWAKLHLTRSFFPLAGAIFGAIGAFS
ncbi:hypothetical protein F4821DRAFT_59409 [Hypoxylon rubiginosum]|uniref:Uncharacterized protein n=1 Tax=Hypoxylon rubiginosum TaxID=110542 RepID=A0ACC0CJB6_9PEZI|nr:hypothetical protein F4821DRAFT_59409 [Hypoxylon rubiginosum]